MRQESDWARRGAPPRLGIIALAGVLALAAIAAATPAAAAQQPVMLRGRVIDAATHTPLAAAELGVGRAGAPAHAGVVTGSDGRWAVHLPDAGSYVIRVRHLGYAPRTLSADAGRDTTPVTIELTPVPVSLDAIVVTASRRPQELKDVPVATEVVSRADIVRTGASDLASVLDQQIGITPTSGHPSGAGVMLQGLDEERVLVLLDGHPIVGRPTGTFDLSRIPTSIIDRVEIVKGSQSTLYGSDAMGGVINIITRPAIPGAQRFDLEAIGGSQGRRDLSGQVAGGIGPSVGYVASLGHRDVLLAPGMSEGGSYSRRWDGLGTVHWAADSAWSLETSAMYIDEQQRWNEGQLYYFADNRQVDARAGAVWQRGMQRFTPTLHISRFDHTPLAGTTPTMPSADSGELESQQQIDADLLYSNVVAGQVVEGGLDLKHESIRSTEVLTGERGLNTAEPFAQATVVLGRFQVVPGMRLSWNQQWGTHWTPRLAAMFRPVPRLALRASVGYGFRAPDFKELYLTWVNNVPGSPYAVHGNPDLQPETSRNLTASVEWAGERVYARLQAFDTHVDNYIESPIIGDSSGFTVYGYANVDRAHTRGADLDAGLTVGALRLDGGLSLLRATWVTTGADLLGRPARSGRLAASYTLPFGLKASVTGLFTGRTAVQQSDDGTMVYQSAFTRLDAQFAQPLPQGFDLIVGGDNLFDAHPVNWPGAAVRQMYVGVRWHAENGTAAADVPEQ